MGSVPAMKKGAAIQAEDEFHGKDYKQSHTLVAEGVQGYTPYKGTLNELVEQIVGGLRSGLYYVGAKTIDKLWKKAEFVQISPASLNESHPHDILVSDPGENYI
jgi:IMP dehydrogenase